MQSIEHWSYWERKNYSFDVDFVIIGAGIVGYNTALQLRRRNPKAKIVVIERGLLPSGASTKNAGFACFGSATELFDDMNTFGPEVVWETVEMRWKGLRALRKAHGDAAIDFQPNGSWDLITEQEITVFEAVVPHLDEYNYRIKCITGESDVYRVDDSVGDVFGFQGIQTSIRNILEGQIDTGKMNTSLYQQVTSVDIRVLFGVHALSVHSDSDNISIETNLGILHCKKVAICTNGFARHLLPEEDVSPARAQVLITEPIRDLAVKGTFHYQTGYYYFRNIDNRILLGGGRNLDKEGETTTEMITTDFIMRNLEKFLHEVILPNREISISMRWAGVMGVGGSKRPILKEIRRNVYCGVRLGGMGIAIGTLVGQELGDAISEGM